MTRTLIISDLHIGARFFHTVLTRPEPLDRLCAALADVDRLVLLGDTVELMERQPRRAMATAEPILRRIASALPTDSEVVVVPGNHDGPLARPWARRLGPRLELTTSVPLDASHYLDALSGWLGRGRVRASYPGVWIEPGILATHGHYLDQHLMPVSSFGLARGRLRRPATDRATVADYERGRMRTTPRRGARSRSVGLLDDAADRLRELVMPAIKHRVLHPRHARVTSLLLRTQFNHAGMPALGRVMQRLGVDADWVIFGHLHRLGPMAGDDPALWVGPGGGPRFANTGSWLYEPLVLNNMAPPNPYWPGGCVVVESGGSPQTVNLLEELDAAALITRAR